MSKKLIKLEAGSENLLYTPTYSELAQDASLLLAPVIGRADIMLNEIISASQKYAKDNPNDAKQSGNPFDAAKSLRVEPIISYPSNVIAFCGSRGQGKSSAMLTYAKSLSSSPERFGGEKKDGAVGGIKSFCVLQRMDPNHFESNEDLLSVVMSLMLRKIEDCEDRERERSSRADMDEFLKLLRECEIHAQDSHREDGKHRAEEYSDELTGLLKKARQVNLRSIFAKLVMNFLHILYGRDSEKSMLVIPIDDIDIAYNYEYSITETIRRYLDVPNVVILLATNAEQLLDVIRNYYAKNFDKIGEKTDDFSNKLYRRAVKYTEKVIPLRRRIYLPSITDSRTEFELQYFECGAEGRKTTAIIKSKDGEVDAAPDNPLPLDTAVWRYITQKTGVHIKNIADAELTLPRTMRELADLMAFLHPMKDFDVPERRKEETQSERLRNLGLFEDYIVEMCAVKHIGNRELIKEIRDIVYAKPEAAIENMVGFISFIPDVLSKSGSQDGREFSDSSVYREQIRNAPKLAALVLLTALLYKLTRNYQNSRFRILIPIIGILTQIMILRMVAQGEYQRLKGSPDNEARDETPVNDAVNNLVVEVIESLLPQMAQNAEDAGDAISADALGVLLSADFLGGFINTMNQKSFELIRDFYHLRDSQESPQDKEAKLKKLVNEFAVALKKIEFKLRIADLQTKVDSLADSLKGKVLKQLDDANA